MAQAQNYIYTFNNPQIETLESLFLPEKMIYLVGQLEKGTTPHFQFVIKYKNKQRQNTGAKIEGCWGEICKDPKAALAYCQKEETRVAGPWIYGEIPKHGGDRKSTAKDLLMMTDDQLLELSPYQAIQGKRLQQLFQKTSWIMEPEDFTAQKNRHVWLCGPPNCGKSYYIKRLPFLLFQIPTNNDWSGYNGEQVLYLDAFKGQLTIQMLERICDGGAKMNTKGGTIALNNNLIVWIGSNYRITECFKEDTDTSPLKARFIEHTLIEYELQEF